MAQKIMPSQPSGVQDYPPEVMIPRQRMLDTIRKVFESFGFVPLDTPCIEYRNVLTGGEDSATGQIYNVYSGRERAVGEFTRSLRFDLTVALARFVAANPNLQLPLKRYQVGKVFRGERPQAGRYNEFVQFDADSVGTASMAADAEIIAIMVETMNALHVPNALVRVNNRKILNGLAEFVGFDPSLTTKVLRVLDKQDKVGFDAVLRMLRDGDPEAELPPLLNQEQLNRVSAFLNIADTNQTTVLHRVTSLMQGRSEIAMEGVRELTEVVMHVNALGIPNTAWCIDLSVARGLGYYTGPVFETTLKDLPSIGSVFSGGRFDGLVSRFSDRDVPATGASVGVDRLVAALQQLGLFIEQPTTAQVIVLPFDDTPDVRTACATQATVLRQAGINVELAFDFRPPRDAITFAAKRSIPVAVIIGKNELASGNVAIRDMTQKKQFLASPAEALQEIQALLSLKT